eukprot:2102906-Amphidinium_carterae.1
MARSFESDCPTLSVRSVCLSLLLDFMHVPMSKPNLWFETLPACKNLTLLQRLLKETNERTFKSKAIRSGTRMFNDFRQLP